MRSVLGFLAVSMMVGVAACSGSEPGDTSAGGSAGAQAGGSGGAGGATGGVATGGATGGVATGGSGGTSTATTGCESASGEPVSFANDIQPIFQASCGGANSCHFKSLASGGLSLKASAAHDALVGKASKVSACGDKTLVVPGDVAQSYLIDKLLYTGKPEICGVRMPYQKPKLADAQIQTLVAWICQGAKND